MKITTFLVLLLLARKELLGLPHTNLGKRTIAPDIGATFLWDGSDFPVDLYPVGSLGLCLSDAGWSTFSVLGL